MNLCTTCQHWKACETYETGHSVGLGRCTVTPMLWDSTQWSEDGEGREFLPEAQRTTAFVQDGSDYAAYLYTRPEHGCVMHETT
jgi:hypothetical protein